MTQMNECLNSFPLSSCGGGQYAGTVCSNFLAKIKATLILNKFYDEKEISIFCTLLPVDFLEVREVGKQCNASVTRPAGTPFSFQQTKQFLMTEISF